MSDKQEMKAFDAGFEFARRMASSDFRVHMQAHGWQKGMKVIMADDDEPFVEVIAKMIMHEAGDRALVAIPASDHPHGFKILIVERLRRRDMAMRPQLLRAERIKLGPGASVGMLYSAFESCGTYIPSDITRTFLFEKVAG